VKPASWGPRASSRAVATTRPPKTSPPRGQEAFAPNAAGDAVSRPPRAAKPRPGGLRARPGPRPRPACSDGHSCPLSPRRCRVRWSSGFFRFSQPRWARRAEEGHHLGTGDKVELRERHEAFAIPEKSWRGRTGRRNRSHRASWAQVLGRGLAVDKATPIRRFSRMLSSSARSLSIASMSSVFRCMSCGRTGGLKPKLGAASQVVSWTPSGKSRSLGLLVGFTMNAISSSRPSS
jgi:hypothetical protein